jgi:hypothetical protein
MYYWAIKWKSFNEDELLVSEKQKEYIEAEWNKSKEARTSQTFKIKGETYSYDSIERIISTTKKILDSQKLLYAAGQDLTRKKQPLVNEDGDVVTSWYKRYVSDKEYNTKYNGHSSYKIIGKEDGGIWIGFRKIMYDMDDMADDIEPCTEEEANRLWRSLTPF